jgi:guanylate kinase
MNDELPQYMPFLIVVSGPSGAGKSSIARAILSRNPEIHYSVSLTTRPVRREERDGADYHFTTEADFRKKIEGKDLIEWAQVHGAFYGTPREPILKAFRNGRNVLLDIDVQGGRQIRESFDQGLFIFVLPPSHRELDARLRGRMTDEEDVIERRLREACREVEELKRYDYLVINNDLDESVARVEEIIRSEACRIRRLRGVDEWIRSFQLFGEGDRRERGS